MSIATAYLLAAVAGAVVPYVFFVRFFGLEGPGVDFIGALFVNGAAGGFSADLLISSFVFWAFVATDGARVGVTHRWLYVVLNLVIGLSCALPLFLWAREQARGRDRGLIPEPPPQSAVPAAPSTKMP